MSNPVYTYILDTYDFANNIFKQAWAHFSSQYSI